MIWATLQASADANDFDSAFRGGPWSCQPHLLLSSRIRACVGASSESTFPQMTHMQNGKDWYSPRLAGCRYLCLQGMKEKDVMMIIEEEFYRGYWDARS